MSTLSPVEPTTTFSDMETLVCDAQAMVDALYALVDDLFSLKPDEQGRYVLTSSEGCRLFFLGGMATAMTNKVHEAYYVAHENARLERQNLARGAGAQSAKEAGA